MPQIVAYKMSNGKTIHTRCLQAYQKKRRLDRMPPTVELRMAGTHDDLPAICNHCYVRIPSTKGVQFKSIFDK